jgi:alpha-beta hydrolase superfamily lysophospholipase
MTPGDRADLAGQTFVLVHGAWQGGWCWREVACALRARGARVFTPTMTGMGERRHLRAAFTGLATYIDDVCGVIEYAQLSDVVLVGHSFGGMCITGVADRMPDRIRRLVYLDACVPKDGQSLVTQSIANPVEMNDAMVAQLTAMADHWLPVPSLETIGVDTAPEHYRQRELALMTEHPVSSVIEPLQFVNGGPSAPCTYIVCDNPPMPNTSFVAHYEQVLAGAYGDHWTARRIDTGHMCMFTALDETVAMIAEAALA